MPHMERNPRGRPRHPDILTPAEWRVLDELRDGGTNADIAARLGISLDAVKYHISNMLGKLELQGRHELAAWRPDAERGRLGAVFAVPAIVWSLTRPLVWIGAGAAAVAGTVVGAIVVVAVIVVARSVAGGDGERAVSRSAADAHTRRHRCDAVVGPVREADGRGLHPSGVPGSARRLRAGGGHPRRRAAHAGHRRSLRRAARAAGDGGDDCAAAQRVDAVRPAVEPAGNALAGLAPAAHSVGRYDVHVHGDGRRAGRQPHHVRAGGSAVAAAAARAEA